MLCFTKLKTFLLTKNNFNEYFLTQELSEQLETMQEELQMHKNDVVRLKNIEIDLKKKIGVQVEKQNKLTVGCVAYN